MDLGQNMYLENSGFSFHNSQIGTLWYILLTITFQYY